MLKEKNKVNKKKSKNTILISVIIVTAIIILSTIIGLIIIYKGKAGIKNSDEIEKQALLWYYDHDELYDKVTLGALHENGYINYSDKECRIVNINANKGKAYISMQNDCEYNNQIKDIPTINVKLIDGNGNEIKKGGWTSSDITVKLDYVNQDMIEDVYISETNGKRLDNMVIKSDKNLIKKYQMHVILNDSKSLYKEFEVSIDKTPPKLESKNIDNNYYTAVFKDEDSGISDTLYYASTQNEAPSTVAGFEKKINLENNNHYYIWAVAINTAGLYSDIVYVGELDYKLETDN